MDTNFITTIIGSLGNVVFPAVMCLLMFRYVQDLNDSHKAETDSLTGAISELKITLQKLLDRLDGKG